MLDLPTVHRNSVCVVIMLISADINTYIIIVVVIDLLSWKYAVYVRVISVVVHLSLISLINWECTHCYFTTVFFLKFKYKFENM